MKQPVTNKKKLKNEIKQVFEVIYLIYFCPLFFIFQIDVNDLKDKLFWIDEISPAAIIKVSPVS